MTTGIRLSEVSSLDRYLFHTMRGSPVLESVRSRCLATDTEDPSTKRVRDRIGSGYDIREPQLVEMFGPPAHEEFGRILFDLVLWPDHRFGFERHESGLVYFHGFELKEASRWASDHLAASNDPNARLRLGHHTMDDVREILGEPSEDLSWGEQAAWLYRRADKEDAVLVLMDFRLLTEIVDPYVGERSGR